MNQRPNQPGVISSTGPVALARNDSVIGATYTSFDKQRCPRHCPMLHTSGRGFQLSCALVRPFTSARARASAALSSDVSRMYQDVSSNSGPWCLGVKRFSITDTTLEKLRPVRNGGKRIGFLGQKTPKCRMMPAEVLPGAVAVLPNAFPKFVGFRDELLA